MYMKPKLSRALITNITENHLNWHSDFDEYIRAKKNIFENADCRAITLDSAVCEDIARKMRPDILISDRHKASELYSLYRPQLVLTR